MATPIKTPTSKIELRFKCTNLKDLDVLSKSDPMIVVYNCDQSTQGYTQIGRTEQIKNNLNPTFKTPVKVDYYFEEIQKLRFVVYDIDNSDNLDRIQDQDIIGEASTTLGNILSKAGQTASIGIVNKENKPTGQLIVSAEEIKTSPFQLRLKLGGEHLDKKDLFGKSDPYFQISRRTPSGQYAQVYQSEVIKNTLDPNWKDTTFKLEDICSGDMNAPIKFDVWDWDSVGKHDLIGTFIASVSELVVKNSSFNLINEKKREKSKSYKNSGVIKVYDSELFREHNFLEYIVGGCEISLVVGIDCTSSNGELSDPKSLHYQHPTQPNQYANAIVSIGNVLAPYDSDGLYPVFGFGGKPPGADGVNHCFPMGLSPENLFVRGVEGILDVYYRNIKSISLYGPTHFKNLIETTAAQFASQPQNQQQQKYTILLIITDGEILDMENTIDAIVQASSLPMSIVIVGVGSQSHCDFASMNALDGDGSLLRGSRGNCAERDIVQFVPMRDFINLPFGALAAETLREIPQQFMQFMNKYKIRPNPPRQYVPQPVQSVPVQPVQEVTVQPVTVQPVTVQPVNTNQ